MEKLEYKEAKAWFWLRTWVWAAFAVIAAAIVFFLYMDYVGELNKSISSMIWISLACGLVAVLLGVLAARISLNFVWMRRGKWKLWPITAIMCSVIAGVGGVLVCTIILSRIYDNIHNMPSNEVLAAIREMMFVGLAITGLMGAIFGTWFSLRFDKYFVESL